MSNIDSAWEPAAMTAGLLLTMACCGSAIFWCLKKCAGSRRDATRQMQDGRGDYDALHSPDTNGPTRPGLTHRSPEGRTQTPQNTFHSWTIEQDILTPRGDEEATNGR